MSKRIQARDRSTVILTYSTMDANSLRMMAQQIRLKGDRKPSLSLIARRSMQVYQQFIQASPFNFEAERQELEKMVTRIPKPAKTSKKKAIE